MNLSILTPEALKRLTPEKVRSELRRLTPEQRKDLKPEQVAAAMETFGPRYRLTPDEQHRREAALKIANVDGWQVVVKPLFFYSLRQTSIPAAEKPPRTKQVHHLAAKLLKTNPI